MSSQLEKLFETPVSLKRINVSKGEMVTLDDKVMEWIRDFYKSDFELWDAVHKNPEKFKAVYF